MADESCFGAEDGEAYVDAWGGASPYTYAWDNGSTDQWATGFGQGDHSVTVTDSNGCSATSSPSGVTVNSLPTAGIKFIKACLFRIID